MASGEEDDSDKTVFGGQLPDPEGEAGDRPKPARPVPAAVPPPMPLKGPRPEAPQSRPAIGTAPEERTIIGQVPLPPSQGEERTVIGGLPQDAPRPPEDRTVIGQMPAPPVPQRPADERTVIGNTPLPPAEERTVIGGAPPAPGAPGGEERTVVGQLPGQVPPGDERTVIGGAVPPPPPSMSQQQPAPQAAPPGYVPPQGAYPGIGAPPPGAGPRISLGQALSAGGLGAGASSNPLVAAASSLLILFGRLRSGIVDVEPVPLMEHIRGEIDLFERSAVAAGVDPHEAMVAKYALSGTADDIVQNLPGADRGLLAQYAMVLHFFGKPDSGVGFFQEAEKAIQAPGQRYNLLDLMLVCLNLGFEGQYRNQPGGAAELARIRHAIHETLRRVKPRGEPHLSPMWRPVVLNAKRRFGRLPVWGFLGMAAAILVAFYATLSMMINRDGQEVAQFLYTLHPTDVKVVLERAPGPVFEAPDAQLERIQTKLEPEIEEKVVDVGQLGDFITVTVGNSLLFPPNSASVNAEFAVLAQQLAEVLDAEDGPVRVIGHTDSVGSFAVNQSLSVQRAESVAEVLRQVLADPARVTVEGRGEAEPIADNSTEEGRAANRRVEIKLAKEGTF